MAPPATQSMLMHFMVEGRNIKSNSKLHKGIQ